MAEKKNNGDFLRCVQELESSVPENLRPVWRKVAVHVVSLEQEVQRMREDHTDPATGEPYDVRAAFQQLDQVVGLMADVKRALNWAQAGVVMATVLLPIVATLGGYIWYTTERQVQANTAANLAQTEALERITGAINVLSIRLDHMEDDHKRER